MTGRGIRRLIGLELLVVCGLALSLPGSTSAAANPTKLSISCTPKALSPGVASTCTATVTDAGPVDSRTSPAGTVTFTIEGVGSLDPADGCLLEPSGAFSSHCTVTYTPDQISGGTHSLLGTYNGEDAHGRATSQFRLSVAPVNDELGSATPIPVPGKLPGTTEGATFNWNDDPELCSDAYAPVWYSVKAVRDARLAVRLTVSGRVDSVVAVFRQERTKLTDLGCELTDTSGAAGVPFDAARGATYLVAVAAPWDANSGGFTIETAVVPPVKFPGSRLAHSADVRLDPLLRPGAVFSVRLAQAATYRFDGSAGSACVHLALLKPAATSSTDAIAESEGCSGYLVFTPGEGMTGTFPVLVSLPEGRAATVHVSFSRAQADDLAPGLTLANGELRRGRLDARSADVVDVYQYRMPVLGDASLTLRGHVRADLLVLDEKGKQLACACDGLRRATIAERLAPGSYFAVVRGRPGETGNYRLSLRLRNPTTTSVALTRRQGALPALSTLARISPGTTTGRIVFELERFDPLTKWHFVKAGKSTLNAGVAQSSILPRPGAWRVRARFSGTLSASPSVSDWINFLVHPAPTAAKSVTGVDGTKYRAPAIMCAPKSELTFPLGKLTIACTPAGFADTASGGTAPEQKSIADQLADLRTLVSGISMLKDPFRSELLDSLDGAREALAGGQAGQVRARLDDVLAELASVPQAQLNPDRRTKISRAATRIKASLGTGSLGDA
jgi:hypothetical protein